MEIIPRKGKQCPHGKQRSTAHHYMSYAALIGKGMGSRGILLLASKSPWGLVCAAELRASMISDLAA